MRYRGEDRRAETQLARGTRTKNSGRVTQQAVSSGGLPYVERPEARQEDGTLQDEH